HTNHNYYYRGPGSTEEFDERDICLSGMTKTFKMSNNVSDEASDNPGWLLTVDGDKGIHLRNNKATLSSGTPNAGYVQINAHEYPDDEPGIDYPETPAGGIV